MIWRHEDEDKHEDKQETWRQTRKFYIRRNNNNVDSIETGRIVIGHLFPWSDLEKYM